MVIRKASEDTDQMSRSLLQKAIRRGCQDVAIATFFHLSSIKEEFRWLRARLAVFTFEEAWPYGTEITFGISESENLNHILLLCSTRKNKDAAGLGSLAYALSQGDNSVLQNDTDDWFIRVVARALQEKDKFREWAKSESSLVSSTQATLVMHAIEGSKKAGWPWDKAFTYAAALLALKNPVPSLDSVPYTPAEGFPFWVAIDKHTQEGKEAIRNAANQMHVPVNTAQWISFYFESAKCAYLEPSPWWERERRWRFSKLQITEDDADKIWAQMSGLVEKHLEQTAHDLSSRVMKSWRPVNVLSDTKIVQHELF